MSQHANNSTLAWKPSAPQLLLLHACLDDNDQLAETALRQWCHAIQGTAQDPASRRLFPMLWRRWGFTKPAEVQLPLDAKRACIQSWEAGHRLLRTVNQLSSDLGALGIPTLLIKGLPLALQAYGDLARRPMSDIDLAVPFKDAPRAINALTRLGWHSQPTPLKGAAFDPQRTNTPAWLHQPRPLDDFGIGYRCVRHAHAFRHADGRELDLHWFLIQGQCEPGIDDVLWATSVPLQSVNRSSQSDVSPLLLCPSPPCHLLLLLAHAARWDPLPSIRWIADAVVLIRTTPTLDWSTFAQEAKRRRLTLPAWELLSWLEHHFKPGIPAHVLSELLHAPVSGYERYRYRLDTSQPTWKNGVEEFRYLFQRYKQIRKSYSADDPSISFSCFACHILGAPGRRALLHYALQELYRRSRRLPAQGRE